MSQYLLPILIFLAVLIVDLITDYRRHLSKKPINHTKGFFLRLAGLIPAILFLPGLKVWESGWGLNQFVDTVYGAGMIGMLYLILFNGIFGVLIAGNFFFLGTTSKIDRLMRRLGIWAWVIQYGLLVAFTILYFL